MKGGVYISKDISTNALEIISELERMEARKCNIPVVFAEMFKDEINANGEKHLFDEMKRFIKKYSEDKEALSIINEYTKIISGGASLIEILQIARDEAADPSAATDITVSKDCKLH